MVVEQERSEWESVISTSIWRTIPLPQHQRVASCLMEGLASCTMEAVATPVSLRFKKVLALSLAVVVASRLSLAGASGVMAVSLVGCWLAGRSTILPSS